MTDHEGRALCASCLKKQLRPHGARSRKLLRWMGSSIRVLAGIFLAWAFFYYIGLALLRIPSAFHEGSIWSDGPSEPPPSQR
ncbi:MAG: hypothetical protein AB1714_09450 [Acidobacteriota bacterium]